MLGASGAGFGGLGPPVEVAADDGFWILGVRVGKGADAAGAGGAAGALEVVADDAVVGVIRKKIGGERGGGGVRGRGEVEPGGRGAADGFGVEGVFDQGLAARSGRVAVDARVEQGAGGVERGHAGEVAERAEGGRAVVIGKRRGADERGVATADVDAGDLAGVGVGGREVDVVLDLDGRGLAGHGACQPGDGAVGVEGEVKAVGA
jgi:hypothetical protein